MLIFIILYIYNFQNIYIYIYSKSILFFWTFLFIIEAWKNVHIDNNIKYFLSAKSAY